MGVCVTYVEEGYRGLLVGLFREEVRIVPFHLMTDRIQSGMVKSHYLYCKKG